MSENPTRRRLLLAFVLAGWAVLTEKQFNVRLFGVVMAYPAAAAIDGTVCFVILVIGALRRRHRKI
jgi:hypothetical protein